MEFRRYLVIRNESNFDIISNIYVGWAPYCKVSTYSKIIKPNQEYPHSEKKAFKFKIVAKFSDNEITRNLLGPQEWNENKVIKITELLECQSQNFDGRLSELYLRKVQRKEETSDLYDTLGLDMEDVRKMNMEDQEKAIKEGYERQKSIWKPEKNFGDNEIATEIENAYEDLKDDERRASYHNKVDYDKGWFSKKGLKARFWPECPSGEQKKAFRRRIRMFALSLALATAGLAFSIATAGAAAPVLVILGTIFGGASTGAGFQSLGYTMSKKSVVDGSDWKTWGLKALIGFVGGAITGGAGVGITAGMIGIGSAALQSSAVTAGQYAGMGAATGAVGGVVSSLSSDFAKSKVDGKKIALGQAAFRALFGGVIGTASGVFGGLVTKAILGGQASAATSTLKGDAVEQVSALTGGRVVGNKVALVVSKQVTIAGTKTILGIPSKVFEERLDNSVENRKILKHVRSGLMDIPISVAQNATFVAAGAAIGLGIKEAILDEPSDSRNALISKEQKSDNYLSVDGTERNIQEQGYEANENQPADNENNKPSNGTNEEQEYDEPEKHVTSKLKIHESQTNNATMNELKIHESQMNNASMNELKIHESQTNNASMNELKIHESQMNNASMNELKIHESQTNNASMNELKIHESQTNNASMNELESCRSRATEERNAPEPDDECNEEYCRLIEQNPHGVSEESRVNQSSNGEENVDKSGRGKTELNDDEKHEVTIKYISKGYWFSKMIVTYCLGEVEYKEEVSGDGKRVHIPADATDVRVQFKVRRPFWGDIMKYDRFSNTWWIHYTSHVFRYNEAKDRTFTISGPLWWEAVMRVNNEYHEETKEME